MYLVSLLCSLVNACRGDQQTSLLPVVFYYVKLIQKVKLNNRYMLTLLLLRSYP